MITICDTLGALESALQTSATFYQVYLIALRTGLAKFVNEFYKLKHNRFEYYFSRTAILEFFLIYNKHHKNDGSSVNEIG